MSSKARQELRNKLYKEWIYKRKSKCEDCGVIGGGKIYDENGYLIRKKAGENLTVHHVDGDITNNESKNLQTLCRKCHEKRHRIVVYRSC